MYQARRFGIFMSYPVALFVSSRQLKIVLQDVDPPAWPVHLVCRHVRLVINGINNVFGILTPDLLKKKNT